MKLPQPETPKLKPKPKSKPETKVNKRKLKKPRKDFDELRHNFEKKNR